MTSFNKENIIESFSSDKSNKNYEFEKEIFSSFEIGSGLKKGDKVVVAMSGGVDSSVTATVLHHMGFDVLGVTLRLYESTEKPSCATRTCCVISDINDAKNVADQVGFQHYTLGYESIFRQEVIDYFVDSYMRGETPIPCVKCNQTVKFKDLLAFSKKVKAKALFTGHYLRRVEKENRVEMHVANDQQKDQTYFLFGTTYDQLEYVRFPLGNLEKPKVREYAKFYNIPVANKLDSQDICFVPDGNYSNFVVKIKPEAMKKGDIIYIKNSQKIGEHEGIIKYTIGQRKGINIAHSEPLYVIKIDPEKNMIIVGEKKYLGISKIFLKEVNILTSPGERVPEKIMCKVRSNQTQISGTLFLENSESSVIKVEKTNNSVNNESLNENTDISFIKASVMLEQPEPSISPGQACVFYDGDRVIGGGWIDRTES